MRTVVLRGASSWEGKEEMGNGLLQQLFSTHQLGGFKAAIISRFLEHPLCEIHSKSKAAMVPAHPCSRRMTTGTRRQKNSTAPPRGLSGSLQRARFALHQGPAPASGGVQAELLAAKKTQNTVVPTLKGLKWIRSVSLSLFQIVSQF